MGNDSIYGIAASDREPVGSERASGDRAWMERALELAVRAYGWTSPNPMVGAVVVKDGAIVGSGWHRRTGDPHAETVALDEAGDLARGADLYVTLEPCAHIGRTPPCTDRIIAAGVRRVVCAHVDPDPRVTGRGIAILRAAGIAVEVGLCERAARRLNEQYLNWQRTDRPWVTVKWAQTLDGQAATRAGHSKWITGEEARRDAHRLRAGHDAVLVGIGTALADDPRLTVRGIDGRQPRRVVLDPYLALPPAARLVEPGHTILVCRDDADPARRDEWIARGIDVAPVPGEGDILALDAVLAALAGCEIRSVLVEGGPRVLTAFLRARLANRIVAYVAPKVLGSGMRVIGDLGALVIDDAISLREVEMASVGADWRITGLVGDGEDG